MNGRFGHPVGRRDDDWGRRGSKLGQLGGGVRDLRHDGRLVREKDREALAGAITHHGLITPGLAGQLIKCPWVVDDGHHQLGAPHEGRLENLIGVRGEALAPVGHPDHGLAFELGGGGAVDPAAEQHDRKLAAAAVNCDCGTLANLERDRGARTGESNRRPGRIDPAGGDLVGQDVVSRRPGGLQAETLELSGHPLRRQVEATARGVSTPHGIVGHDLDPPSDISFGNGRGRPGYGGRLGQQRRRQAADRRHQECHLHASLQGKNSATKLITPAGAGSAASGGGVPVVWGRAWASGSAAVGGGGNRERTG